MSENRRVERAKHNKKMAYDVQINYVGQFLRSMSIGELDQRPKE